MLIVSDSAPHLNQFLSNLGISKAAHRMVCRFILAFALHSGRMSCSAVAGTIVSEPTHRAQPNRFTAQQRWRGARINQTFRQRLLAVPQEGLYIFIVDATRVSQAGHRALNTFSTGNRQRRPTKGRRYGKYKHTRKRCHSFTMGLLITPSGIRIPYCMPYYTEEYSGHKRVEHRTDAQLAAQMIKELPIEANQQCQVVVLGDSAYDAKVIHQACRKRNYSWIFPANCERVYSAEEENLPRVKVRSQLETFTTKKLQTIEVIPTENEAVYRRLSLSRNRPKTNKQRYFAYQETTKVHSVGMVRLVFSTKKQILENATADEVKILMCNNISFSLETIVRLYTLRWQIELMFKELKSTLGFDQYRFEDFDSVEGWSELALSTWLYLESYRKEQLEREDLTNKDKKWWTEQRCYGICQAVRLASQQNQLDYLAEQLRSGEGIDRLKQILLNAFQTEYRAKL